MTPIPILDLGPGIDADRPALLAAFERVLDAGQFVGGPEVDAFEREATAFLGVRHAVAVNSGTDALVIALRALGIGPGDEVVTTPFTFFASAEAISTVGATPVFADVDLDTFTLDPDSVEAAVTSRTRAILPVHLFGRVAPMTRLLATARRHGLAVVEDAAQSFGATYTADCAGCHDHACPGTLRQLLIGCQSGTMGDVGAFSFFPSKTLGAFGDGGMLVTSDDAIAQTARMLRSHGSIRKYHNEMLGYNSRLDSLQAAMLRVRLKRVPEWTAARRAIAARYAAALADVDGVVVPWIPPGHAVHQATVRILGGRRDAVARFLADEGIQTMVYYPVPVHRLPVYAGAGTPPMPVAERLAGEVLSLPISPSLTDADVDRVADTLRRALAR